MPSSITGRSSERFEKILKELFNKRSWVYKNDEGPVPGSKELITSWERQMHK